MATMLHSMTSSLRPIAPSLLALAGIAGDAPQDLPVTAVTLYASGVGGFEHRGQVTGDATVALRLRTDQVNDLLKSLVVEDTGGRPGASPVIDTSTGSSPEAAATISQAITGNENRKTI